MQTDQFEPFFDIVKQLNLQFVLGYTGEEFAASLNHIAEGRILNNMQIVMVEPWS